MAFNSNYAFLADKVYDVTKGNEGTSYSAPDVCDELQLASDRQHLTDTNGLLRVLRVARLNCRYVAGRS